MGLVIGHYPGSFKHGVVSAVVALASGDVGAAQPAAKALWHSGFSLKRLHRPLLGACDPRLRGRRA
jgi:hypothetical protein